MTTLVYRTKPKNFFPTIEASACYLEVKGKVLLLKRAPHKPEGNKWGMPAGKMEKGETPKEAALRELYEETGIQLPSASLKPISALYIRKHNLDFVFHVYRYSSIQQPVVQLNDEHTDYRWVSFDEALEMTIMEAGVEVFYHVRALKNKPKIERKEFYFIRHGETDPNPNAREDVSLNQNGITQLFSIRESVENLPFSNTVFSPIQRAVETKDILIKDRQSKQLVVPNLKECSPKVWHNMVKIEDGHGYHVCHDIEQFVCRTTQGVSVALEEEGTPLIVAHGGIHWALCYFLKIENHPWKLDHGKVVHFQPVGDSGWSATLL